MTTLREMIDDQKAKLAKAGYPYNPRGAALYALSIHCSDLLILRQMGASPINLPKYRALRAEGRTAVSAFIDSIA